VSAVIIPIHAGIAVPPAPAHHALRRHLPSPRRLDIEIADREAVSRICSAQPDLAPFGFWHPGALATREQFDAGRDAMLDGDHLGQFRRAMAFLLACCDRRRELNLRSTSYGLKHQVEHALRAAGERGVYCSNGMFIAAAMTLGFRVEQIARTPNAWTNVFPKKEARR
jgi:hypothetical protein